MQIQHKYGGTLYTGHNDNNQKQQKKSLKSLSRHRISTGWEGRAATHAHYDRMAWNRPIEKTVERRAEVA